MAAQLTCDPIIKITLTSNEVFDEVAPGYQCDRFRLTKGLLKPNKFEFVLSKEDLTLEEPDITFELRNKLLAAMVEVKLQSRREENGDIVEYEVEDFFYGYIQNIKVLRVNSGPVKFMCTAYSPDAKMKHSIANNTYIDCGLLGVVAAVTSFNAFEKMDHFDKKKGSYDIQNNCLETEINLINESGEMNQLPYTVQYKESPFDFLKRMARRYAQFMYYENHKFHFGDLSPLEEIHLHTGNDLECYTYEMNMNDHSGILFNKFDSFRGVLRSVGFQKRNENNQSSPQYDEGVKDDDYENEWAKSAYNTAPDYFGDYANSVYELESQPLFDSNPMEMDEKNENKHWYEIQRRYLDRYVMSDSFICSGKADRIDLKLGSVIIIEDDTKTGAENEEKVEHKPLKVIELTYLWDKEKWNLDVKNTFKAIPKEAKVPPYLERDKDGFLLYGDFDLYPKCGPHYAIVVDNRDPENLGRVRVAMSWQQAFGFILNADNYKPFDYVRDSYNVTPWIWVLSPYQGWNHETMLVPEIGDRVLVGFEHNNAERPYVMGSRYSKFEGPMSDAWAKIEDNRVKGFRSRSGHTVEIIDNNVDQTEHSLSYKNGGRIHIFDSKTHAYDILFDTDQKLIRMRSKGNIELYADQDIIMEAGNDVVINAENDISMNATKDMSLYSGENMSLTSDKQLSAKSKEVFSASSRSDMQVYVEKELNVTSIENTNVNINGEGRLVVGKETNATFKKGFIVNSEDDGYINARDKLLKLYSKDIVLAAKEELNEYSKDQNLQAQNSIKINATTSIDLKALTIKEN